MRVMTQLSGVSSPFSLLGFMYPPVCLHIPEGGSLALASAESKSRGDSRGSCASADTPNRVRTFLLNALAGSVRSRYSHQWNVDRHRAFWIDDLPSTKAIVARRRKHRNYMFLVITSGLEFGRMFQVAAGK